MPESPEIRRAAERVAIIGAGLSGLVCARSLADDGLRVQVFDKARGPGGRLSTRRAGDWHFDVGTAGSATAGTKKVWSRGGTQQLRSSTEARSTSKATPHDGLSVCPG